MIQRVKNSKFLLFLFCGLCVVSVILLIFGVKSILWARKQEAIKMTPEEVIEVLEESEFEIRNIEVVQDGDSGPLGGQKQGYKFDLMVKGESYQLFVEDFGEWENAKSAAKRMNEMDDRMHGEFCYAFYYGPIGVSLSPSDERVGEVLLDVLVRERLLNIEVH